MSTTSRWPLGHGGSGGQGSGGHRRERFLPPSVRRSLIAFALILVVELLIAPQLAGAHKALHLLGSVQPAYIGVGILLEAGALLAYAQLTRTVLPKDGPSLSTLLRIDLSTMAVSHVLPGGTAAGAGLGYRLLTEKGVSGSDTGFALATQGIGSAVVLNLVLWLALLISIPLRGFNPLYGTAALVGVLLFAGFGTLVVLLTKGEARADRVLRSVAARIPFLEADAVSGLVGRLATRLRELSADRPLLIRAIAWAAANWLLDAASLWVFLAAFGHGHFISIDSLLVAYGLANVMAAIPVTPGGLGVVEGILVPVLVGFGSYRGVAILGVISYRLVNFWLPIPVGALSYLSLRVRPGASRRARAQELQRLAALSNAEAQDPRDWARRHGLKSPSAPKPHVEARPDSMASGA